MAQVRPAINYRNGKIYIIRNRINDLIYIGSTVIHTNARFGGHRAMARSANPPTHFHREMKRLGVENFYIELVEYFPCGSRNELMAREDEITATYPPEARYNRLLNGRHSNETKKLMSEKAKGNRRAYRRGCIHAGKSSYTYLWMENGRQRSQPCGFGPRGKFTKTSAFLKCLELREQISPMTNAAYLAELPRDID